MIYLIVGRTATGKDFLAEKLAQRGLTFVKSRTTRPKRSDDDESHIFVSQEESDNEKEKVAYTNINGYDYYATKEDIKDKDFYIIDPEGIKTITKSLPDELFTIIYIDAPTEERKEHYLKRAANLSPEDAEKEWKSRNASEDKQFSELEETISKNKQNASSDFCYGENVRNIVTIHNNYDEDTANQQSLEIYNSVILYKKILNMLREPDIVEKIFRLKDGKVLVWKKDSTEPETVSIELLADILTVDSEGLSAFMKAYLLHSDKFKA